MKISGMKIFAKDQDVLIEAVIHINYTKHFTQNIIMIFFFFLVKIKQIWLVFKKPSCLF